MSARRPADPSTEFTTGSLFALAAYGAWGFSPLFWRLLGDFAPLEQLGWRVTFAMAIFLTFLGLQGRFGQLRAALGDRRMLRAFSVSALLIGTNWFLYVYSVDRERVLEASLGYFINPLLNVVLGMLFLGERLRRWQWVAVALAAVGVAIMTLGAGTFPWIALALAGSFGLYGLVRKVAPAGPLLGSNVETLLLLPLSLGVVIWMLARGESSAPGSDAGTWALLAATGAITAVPLLCFSAAARRLPLSTLGFFQYIAPTGQFLLAVMVFREPFSRNTLVAFLCIWAALVVFTLEGQLARRRRRAEAAR